MVYLLVIYIFLYFFNENVYDKLYRSGSVPARIYGTPKIHKFSPSDTFPKIRPIFSSIGTFNYDSGCFWKGTRFIKFFKFFK